MPTADRVLALKLVSDVGSINKDMKGLQGRMKRMGAEAKSWGKAITAGLVIQGIGAVGNAIDDGIKGFKSGRIVADQLGNTWKNLGMDGSALAATLKKVTDSTLALGTSDDEAVAAFTQSIKFTRDYETSLDHLQIAQDLVANGSAPNLAAAFKIIQQASKGSARVVDRFGLTSDTAAGRVRELGRQVEGAAGKKAKLDPMGRAMNRIGEAMETIAGVLIVPALDELGRVMDETVSPAIEDFSAALGDGELAAQILLVAGAVGILAAVSMAHPIIALTAALAALGVVTKIAIDEDWFGKLATGAASARDRLREGSTSVSDLDRAMLLLQDTLNVVLGPFQMFFDSIATAWRGAQELLNLDTSNWLATLLAITRVGLAPIIVPFEIFWGLVKGGFNQMGINIDRTIGGAMLALFDTLTAIKEPIMGYFDDIATAWRGAQELLNLDTANWAATLLAIIKMGLAPIIIPFEIFWGLVKGGFNQMGVSIDRAIGGAVRDVIRHVRNLIGAVRDAWNSLDLSIPGGSFVFAEAFQAEVLGQKVGWPRIAFDWKGTGDLIPDIGGGQSGGTGRSHGGPGGGMRQGNRPNPTGGGKHGAEGSHAGGLWSVPFDEYPARLHQGEMVVPSDFAENMRGGGGGMGGPSITINIGIAGDPVSTGREIDRVLRQFYRRSGGVTAR